MLFKNVLSKPNRTKTNEASDSLVTRDTIAIFKISVNKKAFEDPCQSLLGNIYFNHTMILLTTEKQYSKQTYLIATAFYNLI